MRAHQGGLALVMVLWLLVLLTVIASSHSSNIRTETRLAFNHVESVKARYLAEAGINHAILEMLVSSRVQRWSADGSIQQVQFDTGDTSISVRDIRGLVDINKVKGTTLDTLLSHAGVEESSQRQALIDATLDWRDKDNLKHLHGAEDKEYRRAGLNWAARDDVFTSVEEFRYILGMTNEIFEKISPYLTVNSGSSSFQPDYAPPWLAEAFNAERPSAAAAASVSPGVAGTYRITVLATTTGGTMSSLSAEVKIEAKNNQPYTILSWRSPASAVAAIEIPEK